MNNPYHGLWLVVAYPSYGANGSSVAGRVFRADYSGLENFCNRVEGQIVGWPTADKTVADRLAVDTILRGAE